MIFCKSCVRLILSYASVAFPDLPRKDLYSLLRARIDTGAPWFMRNVDLYRDLDFPGIARHFICLSERYFDRVKSY